MPKKTNNESGDEYDYDSYSEEDEYSEEYSNRNTDSSFSESSFSISDNSSDEESVGSDVEQNPSSLSVINSDITRLFSELFN